MRNRDKSKPGWKKPIGMAALLLVAAVVLKIYGPEWDRQMFIDWARQLPEAFGYVGKHVQISHTIAEQALLPAVRQADRRTYVIADGFSCRSQIKDGTGRRAWHTAQRVAHAFDRQHETQRRQPAPATAVG